MRSIVRVMVRMGWSVMEGLVVVSLVSGIVDRDTRMNALFGLDAKRFREAASLFVARRLAGDPGEASFAAQAMR